MWSTSQRIAPSARTFEPRVTDGLKVGALSINVQMRSSMFPSTT